MIDPSCVDCDESGYNKAKNSEVSSMDELTLFKVDGLFGEKSFEASFKDKFTVFIGENGLGKTTIMDMLFNVMTQKYQVLANFNFESLTLKFKSGKGFYIRQSDVIGYAEAQNPVDPVRGYSDVLFRVIGEALGEYPEERLKELNSVINEKAESKNLLEEFSKDVNGRLKKLGRAEASLFSIRSRLRRMNLLERYDYPKILEFNEYLEKEFSDVRFLYMPTFRRINDDLSLYRRMSLVQEEVVPRRGRYQYLEDNLSSTDELEVFDFGMNRIQEKIIEILDLIKQQTISGFNELNSKLLSQYLTQDSDNMLQGSDLEPEKLKKMLERLVHENKIKSDDKDAILEKIDHAREDNTTVLTNYLRLLMENYDSSEFLENKINLFVDTVNLFLFGKKFIYDSGNLDLFVQPDESKVRIQLRELSSGEKQIISILVNMYLNIDDTRKIFLFIDEPELSMSIEWQSKLLESIMNAPDFGYLFAITHSPFIFENADIFENTLSLTDALEPWRKD
jgi:predicted ATPase